MPLLFTPYAAELSGGIGIFTIILCIVVSAANGAWYGGNGYPYVSDTFAASVQYWLGCLGLTVAAGFLVVAGQGVYTRYKEHLSKGEGDMGHMLRSNTASVVFNHVAALCAVLLVWFDTYSFSLIHLLAAILFFLCATVKVVLNTIVYGRIATIIGNDAAAASLKYKKVVMWLLVVFFIIYIPVGLSLASFPPLTYSNCLAEDLGQEFCDEHRKTDPASDTDLFDYRSEKGLHTMRAVTQHLCIFCIFIYYALLGKDIRDKDADMSAAAGGAAGGAENV